MTTVELCSADDLDYEAYVSLQRQAYAELLSASQASTEFMNQAFYRWKYRPPAGNARIAIVRGRTGYIAANAMFPVRIRCGERSVVGWQSCDTATLPEARGKGLFQGCLKRLRTTLGSSDLFLGFPNSNSMRGFAKLGWRELCEVTTHVSPLALRAFRPSPHVREFDRFEAQHDKLATRLADLGHVMIERSAAYLNWRYADHPLHKYTRFAVGESERDRGFAVVRETTALGRDIGLVMELWGLTPRAERTLLHHAVSWTRSRKLRLAVHMDTALPFLTGLANGFVPIWSKLLPKRQVLMGQAATELGSSDILNERWRAQAGDWDVF